MTTDQDYLGIALKRIEHLKTETRRLTDLEGISERERSAAIQAVWEEMAELAVQVEQVRALRRLGEDDG
jgi:hypothetical protein